MSSTHRRPLTSQDILRFQTVSDPQMSPDGTRLAWVKTQVDAENNRYLSDIMLTDLNTLEHRVLIAGSHPRWSPDGTFIAYLGKADFPSAKHALSAAESVVDGDSQLFVIPIGGGSPRRLTDLRGGVRSHSWSPQGDALAFLTYVDEDRGLERHSFTPPVEGLYEKFNRDVLVTRNLKWKFDGIGYIGNYRTHVVRIAFDPGGSSDDIPVPQRVTSGNYDMGSPTWSPDGKRIAVVGNTHPQADRLRQAFIYLLDMKLEFPVTPLPVFGLEEVRSTELTWSPEGTHLTLCGHQEPDLGHYGNQRLWLVDVAAGTGTCLTADWDRTMGNAGVADMRGYGGNEMEGIGDWEILILVSDRATANLWALSPDGKSRQPITEGVQIVSAFAPVPNSSQLVCLISDDETPADLFLLDRADGSRRRITEVNQSIMEEIEISPPQKFQFENEGVTVDGWVIPALQLEEGEKAPAILYNGGGPGGMRGSEFFFEYQLLAAQGFSVIYINTRGCQGYGEAFCTAILGDWGGADFRDNMKGIEVALETFDFIDPDRLGVAGGSYGGYTTNWIIGNSDIMKAAVSDRCVFNRYSSYGTSDIMPVREFEFGGVPPWEDPSYYLKQSPLRHMGKVKTPTMVVHSALDHRCPVEQGEQLYLALQRIGVPTELVRFSNESHGLSRGGRPWHRVFRMDKYLEWFSRWL